MQELTPDLLRRRAARRRLRMEETDNIGIAACYRALADLMELEADSWEQIFRTFGIG